MIDSILTKLGIEDRAQYARLVKALEEMDGVAVSMLEGRLPEPEPEPAPRVNELGEPQTASLWCEHLAKCAAWTGRGQVRLTARSILQAGDRVHVTTHDGWKLAFEVRFLGATKGA